MTLYDELVARGLIAQVTDEALIKDLINNGKATFYIGFDPTADSLHVGHFMALCLMKRLQMAGNKPIALIGGGTAMIGDPSGRTDMRKMLTPEQIQHNVDCFKKQMARFIDFSDDKALLVNNADWLLNLNYVELLREVGACFSVNNMLRAECYKQRMEKGLSFLEFNYMIMQSYDFYMLYQKYGCNLQFGGNDQWSNMLGGTELIRRKYETLDLTDYRIGSYGQNFSDDELDIVISKMKEADVIVIGSPLYWHNICGSVRNVLDRFYGLVSEKDLKGRDMYFLFQGAAPEKWMLEAGEYTMKRFAGLYGMNYRGMATDKTEAVNLGKNIK